MGTKYMYVARLKQITTVSCLGPLRQLNVPIILQPTRGVSIANPYAGNVAQLSPPILLMLVS